MGGKGGGEEVSREACFYGGAFPPSPTRPRRKGKELSGDFLPKQSVVGEIAPEWVQSQVVSFDCDSLSEECGGKKKALLGRNIF